MRWKLSEDLDIGNFDYWRICMLEILITKEIGIVKDSSIEKYKF